jgi:multisubunit Na+/H+ antiporter MnhG subunit
VKDASWYPYASGFGWGLLVLSLVFVNSGGNLLLALAIAVLVAVISHRIAQRSQKQEGSAEQ